MPRNSHALLVTPRADLCLDFANTLAWRGAARAESLHQFVDLLKWCESSASLPPALVEELTRWAARNPADASAVFRGAIDIRETIYRIFLALTSSETPAAADLRMFHRALAQAPARTRLTQKAGVFGWRVEMPLPPTAASMLAPVVWSAGDLIVGANHQRTRHCANDRCLWLFIDDSKNGSRRWCSMQACGNRAKAHRHYLRVKAG